MSEDLPLHTGYIERPNDLHSFLLEIEEFVKEFNYGDFSAKQVQDKTEIIIFRNGVRDKVRLARITFKERGRTELKIDFYDFSPLPDVYSTQEDRHFIEAQVRAKLALLSLAAQGVFWHLHKHWAMDLPSTVKHDALMRKLLGLYTPVEGLEAEVEEYQKSREATETLPNNKEEKPNITHAPLNNNSNNDNRGGRDPFEVKDPRWLLKVYNANELRNLHKNTGKPVKDWVDPSLLGKHSKLRREAALTRLKTLKARGKLDEVIKDLENKFRQ